MQTTDLFPTYSIYCKNASMILNTFPWKFTTTLRTKILRNLIVNIVSISLITDNFTSNYAYVLFRKRLNRNWKKKFNHLKNPEISLGKYAILIIWQNGPKTRKVEFIDIIKDMVMTQYSDSIKIGNTLKNLYR